MRRELDPAAIQGDIVPGFRRSYHTTFHQTFIPLTITDKDRARAALGTLVDEHITWSADVDKRSRSNGGEGRRTDGRPDVNIAFTASGLTNMGAAPANDQHPAFAAGLADRSLEQELLGDPSKWAVGRSNDPVDVLLNVASTEPLGAQQLDPLMSVLAPGFQPGPRFDGHALPGGVEHFGFRDGLSQVQVVLRPPEPPEPPERGLQMPPNVDTPWTARPIGLSRASYVSAAAKQPYPGGAIQGLRGPQVQATPAADEVWASEPRLPVGQFIVDDGDEFWLGGSFMVWLRLQQRVDKFRQACERMARKLTAEWARPVGPDDAAALLVGRRRDGTPLAHSGLYDANDFAYRQESKFAADSIGVRCPLGSHSRKMNPRTTEDVGRLVIRRGIPYGEVDGDNERGLLFVSYQASIEEQFEVLQGTWANRANVPEPGGSADALVSESSRAGTSFEVPNPNARGSVGIGITNDWVLPTGGLYLFVPARPALEQLAA